MDHAKTDGDPKELKPVKRHTLGWVVRETHDYVILAMDQNGKRGDATREYGYCVMKSDLLRIETLAVGRKA